MSLDPLLRPGLEAFRRRDYPTAAAALGGVASELEGDDSRLVAALAGLAGCLDEGSPLGSVALGEVRRDLESLPDRVLGVDVGLLRGEVALGLDRLVVTPPTLAPASRLPAGTLRFAAFLGFLVVAALVFRFTPLHRFLEREAVITLLAEIGNTWWAPLALVGSYLIAAPIGLPISPLIMAGGVVFGVAKGSLLNYVGSVAGAAVSFALARFLGRDFVAQIAGRRLRRVEAIVARRGFWSLAGVRLIPIPFPIANFGMALAGVRWPTFLGSTAIGLTPGIVLYSYLATVLLAVARGDAGSNAWQIPLAVLLFAGVGLSPTLWQGWARRRRYRRLMGERADRRRP